MKIFLGTVISVLVLGVAGYFSFPFLIEKGTGGLETEIQALKKRIEKAEAYVDKEEKTAQESEVKTDAGLPRIIKAVNTLSDRVVSLENDLKTGLAKNEDFSKKQNALMEESFKRHNELLEKANKEQQNKLQKLFFEIGVGRLKEYILKFKEDVIDKNIGLAKNDLDSMLAAIEKMLPQQTPEIKKSFGEFQELIKKVKADMDSDLPAASNRMDLLWHEIDKLVRK